ncbi:hypothetical protein U1Q18_033364 [Sarracenia purpurea var. burkii]
MEALVQDFSAAFLDRNHYIEMDLPFLSEGWNPTHEFPSSPSSVETSDGDSSEDGGFSDATLKLINQMLMEEDDLGKKPCMFQECLAFQATEKSFYDVLGEKYPPPPNQRLRLSNLGRSVEIPEDYSPGTCSSDSSNSSVSIENSNDHFNWIRDREKIERSFYADYPFESILQSVESSLLVANETFSMDGSEEAKKTRDDLSPNEAREKKTHNREDGDDHGDFGRSNKQLAGSGEESDEQLELFDKVLLCPRLNPHSYHEDVSSLCLGDDDHSSENGGSGGHKLQQNNVPAKASNGGGGGKGQGRGRKGNTKELVDLRALLSQCAQAVAGADVRSANDLLSRIRQHSSTHGDGTERLAHYFANALEARLAGTGTPLYAAFATKRISAAEILRGYQLYVKSCPFNKLSNLYANRSIGKLVENATKLHIIDFGILYGFQWPCLIQHFSVRRGGPPKIRITGIDFPQPGFRPKQRVEETGHRLLTYCQRFNVPFEYTAIAKKWDTINLEDLKIDSDEVLVVNCLYRLRNVPDETVVANHSPRDAVLDLVKRINPDMFIHGVLNGTYNAPFFVTRFREALFHFSAAFDMFEATMPREDPDRMMFEKEIYGKDVMNVIACEGTERVERPETYKQWQVRNRRAGLRQLPLNQEIVRDVRAMVKSHYNKNFVVDEDGKWMLQGWKGRIMYALSCWKPVN